MRDWGIFSFSSAATMYSHCLARFLPSARYKLGDQLAQPLQRDRLPVVVIVLDDLLLVLRSFRHRDGLRCREKIFPVHGHRAPRSPHRAGSTLASTPPTRESGPMILAKKRRFGNRRKTGWSRPSLDSRPNLSSGFLHAIIAASRPEPPPAFLIARQPQPPVAVGPTRREGDGRYAALPLGGAKPTLIQYACSTILPRLCMRCPVPQGPRAGGKISLLGRPVACAR